jgi:hypothetical protein
LAIIIIIPDLALPRNAGALDSSMQSAWAILGSIGVLLPKRYRVKSSMHRFSAFYFAMNFGDERRPLIDSPEIADYAIDP